jgi:hypothetical protein
MSMEEIATFLGWCTAVNFGFLLMTMIVLVCFKKQAQRIHSVMTGLSNDELSRLYFQYMGRFKLLWIVFNLTPYLAIHVFIL